MNEEESGSGTGRCSSEDDISVMTPLLPPPPPLKNGYVSHYYTSSGNKKGGASQEDSDVKSLGNSTISSTAEHLSRRSLSSSRRGGVLDMDQNSVATGMVMDHVSSESSKANPLKRMNRALANDDYSALNQEVEEISTSVGGEPAKGATAGDNGSLASGGIYAKGTDVGEDEDKISNEEIGRLVYSTGPSDVEVASVDLEEQDVEVISAEPEEPGVEQSVSVVSVDGETVTGTRMYQGERLMVSDVDLSDYVSDAVQSILRLSSSDEDSMSDSNASSVVTGVNDSGSNASPPQRLNQKVSHSMEKLDVELEMLRKSYKAAPRRSGRSAYSRHMASDDEIDQIFDSIKKSFKKEARKVRSPSASKSQSAGQDSGEEVKLRRRISEKEIKTVTRWRSNENTRLSSVDI